MGQTRAYRQALHDILEIAGWEPHSDPKHPGLANLAVEAVKELRAAYDESIEENE